MTLTLHDLIAQARGGSPFRQAVAITKSDDDKITPPDGLFYTRGIYVGGTGDVAVLLADDADSVVFKAVPAGVILPVMAVQILATGTTATDMLALY